VLTPRQIAFIDHAAARPMRRLDYLPEDVRLTPAERLRFSLADRPLNTGTLLAWRAREALLQQYGHRLADRRLIPEGSAS
jgi:hypothetical protein